VAQELPYPRKQQLAAGLLRIAAILQLGKGLWLSLVLRGEPEGLPWVVAGSHLGIAVATWAFSFACKGRPLWGKLAILPVLLIFLLLDLPKHPKLDMLPPWNIVLVAAQILPGLLALLALAILLSDPQSRFSQWRNRHRRAYKLLQGMLIPMLTLVALEIGLRQTGMVPGVVNRNPHVQEVNVLRHYKTYSTDENGIYALSAATRECLQRQLSHHDDPKVYKEWPEELYHGEDWLQRDHLAILNGKIDNAYTRYLDAIRKQPLAQRDPVDQAYLAQLTDPINADGFRSIPFRNDSTGKKKVLMIGDSFTWGHSASYFSTCFSDLLIPQGFAIYNAGISATDPAQYEAIARAHVPVIAPDVVVVNLYMGNDILYFKRPVLPFESPFYLTNGGVILAYPGPERLRSAEEAHAFASREQRIPDTGGWNRLCSKTVLGTLAWKAMTKLNLIPFQRTNAAYWGRCAADIQASPVTGEHLRAIASVCAQSGASFILAVIPQYPEDKDSIVARYPTVFQGLQPLIPQDLEPSDYTARGGHFNDAGHRKFARMLETALRAQ
jgi:hypothetical protein